MNLRRLDDAERLAWLRLIRSENIGPRTFSKLLKRFGNGQAALEALPELIRRVPSGFRSVTICTAHEAERELDRAQHLGVRFLAQCEPDYPAALRAIDASPPLIAVRGSAAILQQPMVAVVGSRNASGSGLVFTERLAKGLGEAGYVVVSGLARGIDGRAHQSSLATGTVAVLAGGHERIYPSEHEALARRILADGAIISEMPLTWEPRARDFPRRNRLVSGLSAGVVVVEASRRSGSLITARFANEQGREVFAVPGSPLDGRAEGPNDLLRQGATLCTSVDDVVSVLAPIAGSPRDRPTLAEPRSPPSESEPLWEETDLFDTGDEPGPVFPLRDSARADDENADDEAPEADRSLGEVTDSDRVLALIGPAPMSIDELIRASDLPARRLQAALTELELGRRIRRHDGNRIALSFES